MTDLKNGGLEVLGYPAICLDLWSFSKAEDMTSWEYAAYDAYDAEHGEGACDKADIWTLTDLFGEYFSDNFYRRKNLLIAIFTLPEALVHLEQAKRWVDGLEEIIKAG